MKGPPERSNTVLSQAPSRETHRSRSSTAVIAACALVVILEGYDQSVYGSVLPVLLRDPGWDLSPQNAGYVGGAAFVGMLLGALGASGLTMKYSRRAVVVGCLLLFGVFGSLCAFVDNAGMLALLRVFMGVGLGGVLPVCTTLTLSVAPVKRRTLTYAAMFTAVPLGGMLAALLSKWLIPIIGAEMMFLVPAPLVVLAIIVSWLVLPDTKAATVPQEQLAARSSGLYGRRRRMTVLFITATLLGLLLWYGLGTWLPEIMRSSGFDLGSSLTFQVTMFAGAAIGSLLFALIADRMDGRKAVLGIYAVGAVVLAVMLTSPSQPVLLALTFLAGGVAQGGLIAINTTVDQTYPLWLRARALGATLGWGRIGAIVGPVIIGYIVGGSAVWSFLLFAACSLFAGIFTYTAKTTEQDDSRNYAEPALDSSTH
ncbi:MFS transporter [Pseudarthrobacter sp. O4]|uniref:MFS transporter n=1 Tax=Pseudarthrobacter sp. O4 TaxID=3418417 RepID=UPI003CFB0C3B